MRSAQGSTGYRAGERAREQLLDAAGEVFAEKGYDRATSREICERAGTNAAAVNYHFGGIDALYVETLARAHRGFVTVEFVRGIVESDRSPKDKLLAYLGPIVRWLANPAARPWQMRLVAKEMLAPSGLRDAIVTTEIQPKTDFLRDIIADLIGAEPTEPVVGQAVLLVVAPTLIMAAASGPVLETLASGTETPESRAESLSAQYERFVLAGLDAVSRAHRGDGAQRETKGARPGPGEDTTMPIRKRRSRSAGSGGR